MRRSANQRATLLLLTYSEHEARPTGCAADSRDGPSLAGAAAPPRSSADADAAATTFRASPSRRPDVDRIAESAPLAADPVIRRIMRGQISVADRLTYCRPVSDEWTPTGQALLLPPPLLMLIVMLLHLHPADCCDHFAFVQRSPPVN